jgi:alpha-glucosidase
VLVLDSTYKTNKYRLPLIQFIGTTSTEQTFSIRFALLSVEKESNFVWALEKCRELLNQRDHPDKVVTDRDNTLMTAVDRVFPKLAKLLCRYNISCNVRTNCKGKCGLDKDSEELGTMMAAWENKLESENEDSYADSVIRFRQLCIPFPTFLEYVESTILGPVKEKVVTTWTKQHMHLGNTTTNRCESTHARLKKYIQDSMSDFIKFWECIGQMLGNMFIEIHRRFENGKIQTTKQLEGNQLFSHVQRNISREGVNLLVKEVNRVRDVDDDNS